MYLLWHPNVATCAFSYNFLDLCLSSKVYPFTITSCFSFLWNLFDLVQFYFFLHLMLKTQLHPFYICDFWPLFDPHKIQIQVWHKQCWKWAQGRHFLHFIRNLTGAEVYKFHGWTTHAPQNTVTCLLKAVTILQRMSGHDLKYNLKDPVCVSAAVYISIYLLSIYLSHILPTKLTLQYASSHVSQVWWPGL